MTLQKPIGSGFNSKTNANKITCDIDLSGKTAIVSGGYSGIGLETSRELVSVSYTHLTLPTTPYV